MRIPSLFIIFATILFISPFLVDGAAPGETAESIKTVDNRTLYVSALKPFSKCAIVFVHGLFGSSQHWYFQYKLWSNKCSTIVFDIYGHGLSKGILKKPDRNVLVKDLQAVLEWSKAEKYVLVGHNYGGVGIQQYATQRSDPKLVAMVLVDSFSRNPPPFREGGDQPIIYLLASKVFKQQDIIQAVRALINPANPQDIPLPGWPIFAGTGLTTNIVAANQIILTNHTFEINNFQKPVFVIYGSLDSIGSKNTFIELADIYRRSSIEAIEGGCHSSFVQYPEEFNFRLDRFLKTVNWTVS